jgi:hypothetical protein
MRIPIAYCMLAERLTARRLDRSRVSATLTESPTARFRRNLPPRVRMRLGADRLNAASRWQSPFLARRLNFAGIAALVEATRCGLVPKLTANLKRRRSTV